MTRNVVVPGIPFPIYDEELKVQEAYPYQEGIKVISNQKQHAMKIGGAVHLLREMVAKGATQDEIHRAVVYSSCVIDAFKYKLDYKRAYQENGIEDLKRKYCVKHDI